MNELDSMEQELQRLRPARPPEDLVCRLGSRPPSPPDPQRTPPRPVAFSDLRWLRWAAPVSAAAIVTWVVTITLGGPGHIFSSLSGTLSSTPAEVRAGERKRSESGDQHAEFSRASLSKPDRTAATDPSDPNPALLADSVEIDRRLMAAYDAIARLPDGEPVRIYCQEWMDEVVLRDSTHGVAVRQRTPRVEIIPLELETF